MKSVQRHCMKITKGKVDGLGLTRVSEGKAE